MPTTEQLRSRLIDKLKELFQLDQPDLDFGFYRIMHAKAEQVLKFLEEDLLKIVEEAFGKMDDGQKVKFQAEYEKAIEQAKDFGATAPEETAPVKKAKAALDALKDKVSAEGEVYDHLYRFFERYYHEGDFISLRYYARETSGKAAPFAIPYNGEEVKLHWANADQYYIKTAENFNNFTVDLSAAKELQTQSGGLLPAVEDKPLRLHFCIVEATEGEHGNVKETDKRFFVIHKEKPVEFNEAGELVIKFEFRPDPEKGSKQDGTWREHRNTEAVNVVLKAVDELKGAEAYKSALKTKAPTEKDSNRPLLARHINQYTARNTYDYFIHKDLGGFLWRELDFYIKNEVMRLDDIENADVPTVESYLSKIKVLRSIAHKLIDFLTQLEEFQKKLWLKKKFVVETNYCITLDRVPEELYETIAANEAQHDEWVKLFAINEIEPDTTGNPGYAKLLTVDFLKVNNKLVLDTRFFNDSFKARLIASIENFDEQCDGLLMHSENFQALNLLQKRYVAAVRHIYIDPPYNTASTPILYKNEYKHSSWNSLLNDRLLISMNLLVREGIKTVAIDDTELVNLSKILETIAPEYRLSRITVVHNPKGSITKDFNRVHEYALFLTREDVKDCIARTFEENEKPRKMRRWGENSLRTDRRLSFYPIYVKDTAITKIGQVPSDDFHPNGRNILLESGEIEVWPIDQDGVERRWNFGLDSIEENIHRITIQKVDETLDLFLTHEKTVPKTVWTGGEYDAGNYGNTLLINILGVKKFDFPKSINLVRRCVFLATTETKDSIILDYFGGSGTTGHAVITLNREDGGKRKYILVEMGNYFDTALKPRIAKVVYSTDWKDGKPQARNTGISHCFKYLRLESYEDALNNLNFDHNPVRDKVLSGNPALREDYMLRYMLDIESRGSQSLLNIDAFADPTAYTLKVKKPGSDEYTVRNVDLLETFNYLIGLRVNHIAAPQSFTAKFKREKDPELPEDQDTRLVIDGRIKQDTNGLWWFRKVEGWVPADRNNPNNGQKEKMLIVWRKLTGDMERDNLMLDEWFKTIRINPQDFEFDTIYVNGSNNLPNLKLEGENWKVRLIEEDFMRLMWDVENV